MKRQCEICNGTGVDESNPEWPVACDCPEGEKAREYHEGACWEWPEYGHYPDFYLGADKFTL